jgi:hypothetical protein
MKKISWAGCVRSEERLQRVKEEGNIIQTIRRNMTNWIGHVLHRNCLLKLFVVRKIEGRIEVIGR